MFGLATRVPDELVAKYFRLATDVPDKEIEKLVESDIWKAKKTMAEALTARHYGAETAAKERAEFERVFKKKELPDEIPEHSVTAGDQPVLALLRDAFDMSSGEAKRMLKQGGVTLDGAKLTDPQATIPVSGGEVLRAGKRRFARLVTRS